MKDLKNYTMDEMVRKGIEKELDAIVKGVALKDRVYDLIELAARWGYERGQEAGK